MISESTNKQTAIFILAFCAVFLSAYPQIASAGRMYLLPQGDIIEGSPILVQVRIDTQGEEINAVEGILEFPAKTLKFVKANDAGTIINFWVERANEFSKPCLSSVSPCSGIRFSGLIPGGFSGEAELLELEFSGKPSVRSDITFDPASKVILNRADGVPSFTVFNGVSLNISDASAGTDDGTPDIAEVRDSEPPEKFKPVLARNDDAFEGKWFIGFAPADKGTGIAKTEAQERFLGIFGSGWTATESPYVVKDQLLLSSILIRATDGDGNTRIERVIPGRLAAAYGGIVILICVCGAVFGARRFVRKLPQIPA